VHPLAQEEYRQLRTAIHARGQLRVALAFSTLAAWAVVTTMAMPSGGMALPVSALVPLLLLVAGFEAVHALHVGAERIGRYLRVRYESESPGTDGPAWETVIGSFGPGRMGAGRPSGALFPLLFCLAVVANLLVRAPGTLPVELGALAILHAAVIARIVVAHRASLAQRAQDEARFRELMD